MFRRRWLTAVSAISLTLCLVSLGWWAQSLFHHDELVFRHAMVFSDGGELVLAMWPQNQGFAAAPVRMPDGRIEHVLQWPPAPSKAMASYRRFPYPLLCIGLLVLPAMWMLLGIHARDKARRAGCCHACGYNLTGNVSGVCPECGKAIKSL